MHGIPMFVMMVLSGALSSMWVWSQRWSDVRLSLNDAYMIALMTGWMFLMMGLWYKVFDYFVFGTVLIAAAYILVRTQWFVSEQQFVKGMIPHHSMAVHMSNRLMKRTRNPELASLISNVVQTQEAEITMLKQIELALDVGN
jgi:Domain of unknown function (DUF305)